MAIKKQNQQNLSVISNKAKVKISAFGLKVLKKLNHSGAQTTLKGGGVKLGFITVPPSLISEIKSQGLVDVCGDGSLSLSEAGISYLRRKSPIRGHGRHKENIGETVSDPYQLQHQITSVVLRRIDGKLRKLNVNQAESPLGWLRKRKGQNGQNLISIEQFEAAERFRCDYDLGSHNKQLVANYDGIPISKSMGIGGDTLTYTETQLDARKRFDKAVVSVGPGLSDSLIRICCHLEGFEVAEKTLGWPSRSMKLVILMALTRLQAHYEKGERPTN